jgi:hypothetical protein
MSTTMGTADDYHQDWPSQLPHTSSRTASRYIKKIHTESGQLQELIAGPPLPAGPLLGTLQQLSEVRLQGLGLLEADELVKDLAGCSQLEVVELGLSRQGIGRVRVLVCEALEMLSGGPGSWRCCLVALAAGGSALRHWSSWCAVHRVLQA